MDRRVGNTKNLGAIFGVLAALGVPVPVPGSLGFKIAQALNWLRIRLTGMKIPLLNLINNNVCCQLLRA